MGPVESDRQGTDRLESETIRRVAWRLMPLLMLGFFCSTLDRANVGMAGLTMRGNLGLSNAVFGFGAGIFFFGYLLGELPSNLILDKVGARRWIARIQFTWGIVSGLTAFVWNDWSFHTIRALLGLAEAGFFPGVLLYLTWWFPSYYRSRMMATFLAANMAAQIIGPPVGGLLLQMNGWLGLHGWQWLFLIEATPAILMSVVTWNLLTDRPSDAIWLRGDQRAWLVERMAAERAQREAIHKFSLLEVFANPKMLLITLAFFFQQMAVGAMFFLPQIVRGLGVTNTATVGLISALPFVGAAVAMIGWGWHSDLTGERVWHAVGAWMVAAGGLVACTVIGVGHPVATMVALILSTMGQWGNLPAFWALPSALLTGTAAAGGLAMVSSLGSLGGWFGPSVFGLVKDLTGSDNSALLCMALAPVLSALSIIAAGHDRRLERIPPRR
jgi:MFS family permease